MTTASSVCRSCSAPIEWVDGQNGKRTPIDLDGTSHFKTCPDAKAWSRQKPAQAMPAPADHSVRVAALTAAATFAAGKCLGGATDIKTSDVLKVAAAFESWLKGD